MNHSLSLMRDIEITPDNIGIHLERLNSTYPMDVAELISNKPHAERLLIFGALSEAMAVATFPYLRFREQAEVLHTLPSQEVAVLLNALSPDDRTAILEVLPSNLVNQLLKYLSPQERALSLSLLNYPENSVGRLMTPDYIAIRLEWTVKRVLDYIRAVGQDSETVNVIYATDDEGRLVDDFRIRQFLFASLETPASVLADGRFIALHVEDNEEMAIALFRKYARMALPVIDSEGMLLGIVTLDDIMAVAVRQDTEDMQKLGGVVALDEPYLHIPLPNLIRKRVGWLTILFLGELLTASAMSYFEAEIAKAVVLALFVPLIISSGGNAGSQASSLIIRAMALGEVTLRDWWRVMRREVISGIVLGATLGLIGFFRISTWSIFSDIYGTYWLLVATTVFLSLIGVVLWGSLLGAMMPLLLKRMGFDPATSSAPFVATMVDVTGLIIYFSIAMVALKGTLL